VATETLIFDLPGLLQLDQVSNQTSVSWKRTLKKVRLSTLGTAPAGADIKVKLRLAAVAQATEYSLPAGLKYAENIAADVEIAADTLHDFIISANGNNTGSDLKVEAEFEVAINVLGGSTTDLGLGTLGQLKRFLINDSVVAETTYDEAITAIGKGVASLFDRYLNRTLKRSETAVEDFRGNTDLLLLGRYPVESVASIGLQEVGESTFTTQTDIIDTVGLNSGVLQLVAQLGTKNSRIRVSYAGGYWYDASDDGTGTLPTGATELPADLQQAWLLMCQHIWTSRDIKGVVHTNAAVPGFQFINTRLSTLDLLPLVKSALDPYRRLML
jgi:hypothetical protein